MTRLSLDSTVGRAGGCVNSIPPSVQDCALPRINLKKRPFRAEREQMNLSTVNSAFLSGLFADVAKVQVNAVPPASPVSLSDPRLDDSKPLKKTRLSKVKSMTRCGKSFKLLSEADPVIPSQSPEFSIFPSLSPTMGRQDSLHYQLSCVSNSSSTDMVASSKEVTDVGKLAFPNLTSTSCAKPCTSKLPRKVSDLQILIKENSDKESYGWFVEMDNDEDVSSPNTSNSYATSSVTDLAFSAPTAPKAANYDAEVEWAKAADTVDDVLGDFF